jgi:hypothetical protein
MAFKLLDMQYAQANDEQKLAIRIDTFMFLTKRIASTFEVAAPNFFPPSDNVASHTLLLLAYGDLIACIIEFLRDTKGVSYEDSLKIINEEAMKFAEVIRKDREECDCEKCKADKEAQNGSNGAG